MSWMKTSEALMKLPALLFQGKLSFDFDGIPLMAKGLSFRKRLNLTIVGIDKILRLSVERGLPPLIHTELTNICNLHCPLCPTGSNTLKRPKGIMTEETFMKTLNDLDHVLIGIYLFNFGEPFLNKSITKMIEACTARNIITLTSTNGNCVQTLDEAMKIVEAGLTALIIAIDGSTQEIYQSYRKGGDLEKVKKFASLIEEAKARCNSKTPYTVIRSVVTSDNANDLAEIEKLAASLGVNMFSYKSLGCLVKDDNFNDYAPAEKSMRRFEYSGASGGGHKLTECIFPFRQPIVFWDGTVVGCEYDHNLDYAFGRIGQQSFTDIWNSPRAVELRKNVRSGRNKIGFCSQCPYEGRSREGTALYCKELNPIGQR
ncbi:MAG: radical SAM protein [Nitrospiraceae bacterium]|nr:MAG: radical SAM protein [Nitrospiraceae bacterium]